MSHSSLWLVDKDYSGICNRQYEDSLLFSQNVCDTLSDKYMHDEYINSYWKRTPLGLTGTIEFTYELSDRVNASNSLYDKICWELSNEQIFYTVDKREVYQAILDFVNNNTNYNKDENGDSPLHNKAIVGRFMDIANDILAIPDRYPHFVLKYSSLNPNVSYWFYSNDEMGGRVPKALSDWDIQIVEFIKVDGYNLDFQTNLDYFEK